MSWREEKVRNIFGELILEGVRTGRIRSDLKPELMILFFQSAVQSVMIPDVLEQHPTATLDDIFETVMKIIFEGILERGDLVDTVQGTGK